MNLHSKITPERPQTNPDHIRISQNHALPLPKPKETRILQMAVSHFKNEKKHISGQN